MFCHVFFEVTLPLPRLKRLFWESPCLPDDFLSSFFVQVSKAFAVGVLDIFCFLAGGFGDVCVSRQTLMVVLMGAAAPNYPLKYVQ